MLFKLTHSGEADLADLDYILQALNLDSSQFLSMCVVAGCDFLPNIKGIGINRARQLVTRNDFLIELSSHRYAPPNYCTGFEQACAVFKHQTIYDLDYKKVRPLIAWEAGEDEEQFSMACGEYPLFNNQSQNLEKCGHPRRGGYLLLVHSVYFERKRGAIKISWGGAL